MKILIVEDEELAAKRLTQLIREIEPEAEISGPLDTVTSTVSHLKTLPVYDLIFLDIQLADGKSFSIFEECQVVTPVIFTTAYDEYALQAFELNSIDYLLKPVNREKLKLSIEKFRKLKEYYGAENPNDQLAVEGRAQSALVLRLQGKSLANIRQAAAANPTDVAAILDVADLDLSGGHVDDAFARRHQTRLALHQQS